MRKFFFFIWFWFFHWYFLMRALRSLSTDLFYVLFFKLKGGQSGGIQFCIICKFFLFLSWLVEFFHFLFKKMQQKLQFRIYKSNTSFEDNWSKRSLIKSYYCVQHFTLSSSLLLQLQHIINHCKILCSNFIYYCNRF